AASNATVNDPTTTPVTEYSAYSNFRYRPGTTSVIIRNNPHVRTSSGLVLAAMPRYPRPHARNNAPQSQRITLRLHHVQLKPAHHTPQLRRLRIMPQLEITNTTISVQLMTLNRRLHGIQLGTQIRILSVLVRISGLLPRLTRITTNRTKLQPGRNHGHSNRAHSHHNLSQQLHSLRTHDPTPNNTATIGPLNKHTPRAAHQKRRGLEDAQHTPRPPQPPDQKPNWTGSCHAPDETTSPAAN